MQDSWIKRAVVRVVVAMSGIPALLAAAALIVVWAATGPFLHFSDVWQLTINTTTTIITFLVGFCILFAQRKDNLALHAKLDTLIAGLGPADNRLIGLEDESEETVKAMRDGVRRQGGMTPPSE